jgi:hypothetical protein
VIARLSALAIAAVALTGCGGKSSTSQTTTQTTTQAAATQTTTRLTTTVAETDTEATTHITLIRVLIKGGKPIGGIQRATAKHGQKVALVVHSNVTDEVHVHGYDLHKDVEAGGTVRIQFVARITGVFEVELESRKLQIAELTVK